jgi:hypothetical protein
LVTVNAEG